MDLRVLEGDLLDQDVEVIVNAWNRNPFPWWQLIPQGVSRAIRRRAGAEPFRELARKGLIPLGGAVETSAGRLPYRAICPSSILLSSLQPCLAQRPSAAKPQPKTQMSRAATSQSKVSRRGAKGKPGREEPPGHEDTKRIRK